MFTWLVFATLFCTGTQLINGPDNGVPQCGVRDMMGTHDSSKQMILVTWGDDPSCSTGHDMLIYELQVLRGNEPLHHDEVFVTADQIGSPHSWSWSPPWALECASHSVRVRSRNKNHTSPWSSVQAVPETSPPQRPKLYPMDRIFEVGSRFTFCCILEPGGQFHKMYAVGSSTAVNSTKISNQTYALTVDLHGPSDWCRTNVRCNSDDHGVCVYVGYRPDVGDLKCESRDLMSVECQWSVKRDTHLRRSPTEYELLGRPCSACDQKSNKCGCKQSVEVNVGERNWTLTAQNVLGKMELTDQADLTKRVHMFAPENVAATTVNARNVTLEWSWRIQKYHELDLLCQIQLSYYGQTHTRNYSGVGLNFAVLSGLIPNQVYTAKVRCGTKQHFWKWSENSNSTFHTKGDIPDALDVWMQTGSNQAIIAWKTLPANQSHGEIIKYEVTWGKASEQKPQHKREIPPHERSVALSLDAGEEHLVAATAWNMHGMSSPSAITVPRLHPGRVMNASLITGANGGFHVSWPANPAASGGYVVDWCPSLGRCSVEWVKVPPGVTTATVLSENFRDGVRYSLSIYACTPGAPELLERREGYVRETEIPPRQFNLTWKHLGSDVEVSWPAISLRNQSAFIQGYIMYYTTSSEHHQDHGRMSSVSTDNPEATSLTARNLPISSYTFTVKALTSVGECGDTSLSVTITSATDNLIMVIIISLVSVFVLLSLTTILCYRHWACVKLKVYPPIPKPILTGNWLTSLDKHAHHRLQYNSPHDSETDTVEVSELCSKLTPVDGDISQEEGPCVVTQTQSPNAYCNQPLRNSSPAALPLISKSLLPPFRGMLENPSYNVALHINEQYIQQPGVASVSPSSQELQDVTCAKKNCAGYQPHSRKETSSPI